MASEITKDIVNEIREEIAAAITAGSTLFKLASPFIQSNPAGFPAVFVVPSENIADYSASATDRFEFAFNLMVYYPLAKDVDYEKAERAVGACVGDLLRIFSTRKPNPVPKCDWVVPVPSVWGDEKIGDMPFRTAIVSLRCVKYLGTR